MSYHWVTTSQHNLNMFASAYTALISNFPDDISDIIIEKAISLIVVIIRNNTGVIIFYKCAHSNKEVYYMGIMHPGSVHVVCMCKSDKFVMISGKSARIFSGCFVDIVSSINFTVSYI